MAAALARELLMAARSAVSATLISYLSYGVGILSSALLIPLTIQALGDSQFALWSLTLSGLSLLSLLEGGLATAWMRFASAAPDGERLQRGLTTMLGTYLRVVAVGLLVLTAISFFYPAWAGAPAEVARPLLWILGARLFYATLPLTLFRVLLHGLHHTVPAQIWATFHQLLYVGLAAAWLTHSGGILGLAWLNLGVALSESLGYVWMAYRRVPGLRLFPWQRDLPMAREFHVQAAAGAVVQLASLVLLKTDPILVKAVLPLQAVALYAVALKVAENYLMFLKQFLPVLTPRLGAAAARRDMDALRRLIIQSSGWATVPAMALGLPFWLGAEGLLEHWVGPNYVPAAPALKILLLSGLLSLPQMVISSALAMSGLLAANARAALLATLLNPIASLLWARAVGLPGIALGTLTATLVVDCLVVFRSGSRIFELSLWSWAKAWLRLHLPGLLLALPLLALTRHWGGLHLLNWCLWAGLGALLYGLAVLFGLPAKERALLKDLRKRGAPDATSSASAEATPA